MSHGVTLVTLPKIIKYQILIRLDYQSLRKFGLTSKVILDSFLHSDYFWQQKILTEFPSLTRTGRLQGYSWKNLYFSLHHQLIRPNCDLPQIGIVSISSSSSCFGYIEITPNNKSSLVVKTRWPNDSSTTCCLKRDFIPEPARALICSKHIVCILSQSHRLYMSRVKHLFELEAYTILAENVKKVVVCQDQGAFITHDLKLWTFNKNHKLKPELSNIVDVARGKHHIICLDKFGRVYGKGTGKLGQLNGKMKVGGWTFLGSGYQSVEAGLNSTFLKTRNFTIVQWSHDAIGEIQSEIPERIFALDHQRHYFKNRECIRRYNIKQIVNSAKSTVMVLGYPKDEFENGIARLMRTARSYEDRVKLNPKEISDVIDLNNFADILTIYSDDLITVLEVLEEKYGIRQEFVVAAQGLGFDVNSLLRLKSGLTTLLIDNIGNLELVQFLLSVGANPNLVNEDDEGVMDKLLLTVCDLELMDSILDLLHQYNAQYWLKSGVLAKVKTSYTDAFLKQFVERK